MCNTLTLCDIANENAQQEQQKKKQINKNKINEYHFNQQRLSVCATASVYL